MTKHFLGRLPSFSWSYIRIWSLSHSLSMQWPTYLVMAETLAARLSSPARLMATWDIRNAAALTCGNRSGANCRLARAIEGTCGSDLPGSIAAGELVSSTMPSGKPKPSSWMKIVAQQTTTLCSFTFMPMF
jgi:hypothetical protein